MPPTYEVLRLAEGYVQVNPLGPVPIKGLSTPLEVYEVTGPGAVRTRLQAASMRGLTRFVGRDTELDQLRQAQERAGFPEAVTAFERAIEALAHLPITLDTRSFAIAFRCDLADGLLPMGELGRSGTLLGEAEALAPQLHDRPRLGHVLAMLAAVRSRPIAAGLGYAHALTGRLADRRALLEEALQEGLHTGALQAHALHLAWLNDVCLLAGRREEARQHAYHALRLARQQQARGNEGQVLRQLGAVHAATNPPDIEPAEAYYRQALTLAHELGSRPRLAHCHFDLGRLYATIGRHEQARTELSTVIDLYRAMDMMFWLAQAEAALAQVEGR